MAKDKLTDYDATASNNTDVGGISVAEGMLPSGVNNAIRELMSHQADAFGAGTPLYVDQTNNRVGVGNAAPTVPLDVTGAASVSGALTAASATVTGDLTVDTNTLYVDSTNNRVGINQASPSHPIHVGTSDLILDSSGNLLVGKTSQGIANQGFEALSTGQTQITNNGGHSLVLNRLTSDGAIATFRKDGTTLGIIGAVNGRIYIGSSNIQETYIGFNNNYVYPANSSGGFKDNAIDLGNASARYDDVFATNGTIQTSDANEKQQIASLTSAEITAATAISKLFKTFKWNDKVEAKGDAARTHTGVIAQQVETAMTDAGLDAGDYAFFISSDWYVDADGNEVEADAEGAIAKNRKGIRYPELLAFVGAATEQRLANIETRLTALENA